MAITGWRVAIVLLLGLALLVLLIAVAVWVALALVVVGAVLWLNLVLLPRLSRRLHVPGLALELTLLPILAGPGWLIRGPTGAALGTLAWLAGIALPRLVGRRLRDGLRSAASRPNAVIIVASPALPAARVKGEPR